MLDPDAGNGTLTSDARLHKLAWALRSVAGDVRPHNEDFAGCFVSDAPEDSWERPPLFVVADGMGGHAAGEVASRLAVEHMLEQWASGSPSIGASGLRSAARAANLAVIDAADAPGRRGMGTTLTALSLCGREACLAHVGDSRAYLLREGSVTQCTTDHSRVGDMLRMKLITAEQAAHHPARSQLTRSLGIDPLVQIDVYRESIKRGDVWVLCSDGLWDVVRRDELIELGRSVADESGGLSVSEAAQQLIDTAIARNTPDNVTVVVVHVTADAAILPEPRRSLFRRRG